MSTIGIGNLESAKNRDFAGFHYIGIRGAQMVVAREMQNTVHSQMGIMMRKGFFLLARFSGNNRRAQDNIPEQPIAITFVIDESKYVGGVVLAAEDAVEIAPLCRIDNPNRHLGRLD